MAWNIFKKALSPQQRVNLQFQEITNTGSLQLFQAALANPEVHSYVRQQPMQAHYSIFGAIPHLRENDRFTAYKNALDNPVEMQAMNQEPWHLDDLVKNAIASMPQAHQLPAFQYTLKKFTENVHRPEDRCKNLCAFIFILPRNLQVQDRPRALQDILENPVMQQLCREEPSRTLFFVLYIIGELDEASKAKVFKASLEKPIVRHILAQEESRKYVLDYAQPVYATAKDDALRIEMARALIAAVQSMVSREQQGYAAYITPVLELEGTLVAHFGKALSNEARKSRGQPAVSFSDISTQFNQARLGWELRPVNGVDDQVKYNHLLPGNNNLFTRAVKRINNQEVHAVIGGKTNDVNISVEPVRN